MSTTQQGGRTKVGKTAEGEMQAVPVVLLLAAGQGRRFLASGGTTHKLYAMLGGMTVLARTRSAVGQAGLACHVVEAAPDRLTMGDSIAAGVRATPHASAWLVLPADMPLVLPGTLREVANALRTDGPSHVPYAVRPIWQGQLGHPVGFSAAARSALLELAGHSGAATVWRACQQSLVETQDGGCVQDIDTVQDWQEMQRQFST